MIKRNALILGLLFLILIVEIIVVAPKELGISPAEDQAATIAPPGKPSDSSSQVMKDVHLVVVEAKADGKEWELWAVAAVHPKDDEKWNLEHPKVKFFAKNGVFYTVTGDKGQVVENKNDMKITGNVVTKSSNGYTFKTDNAFYESKNKMLTSPNDVEMTGPIDKQGSRLELTGAQMTANFGSNEMTVNRNVHAKRVVAHGAKDTRMATIQSQRALFSGKTNQAQFFGDVVMDFDTMRVTGPEATFAYDPKTEAFKSVHVDGGVRLTDTDKFATSGTVDVQFKEDKVVFNGSPRVVQNGDELIGDQIVLTDNGKKVQVSNAKAQIDPKAREKN
jgi:LPS export ABC transporter protein LptC